MKCNNCGMNLSDEAVFCTNCGKKLEEKVVNGAVIQSQYDFNHISNQNSQKGKESSAKIAIVVALVVLMGVTIWQGVSISKQKKEIEDYRNIEAEAEEIEEEYEQKFGEFEDDYGLLFDKIFD